MANLKKIILKRGKEKSLQRRHPWVFSGAIYQIDKNLHNGDMVNVYNSDNQYLASGHFQDSTIAVRVFSFENCDFGADFWRDKLKSAVELRKSLLLPNPETNMFRLINGEGDGFPGLVADVYNRHVVLQVHSLGMYALRNLLKDIILEFLPDTKAIFLKNAMEETNSTNGEIREGWIFGEPEETLIAFENGIAFNIDIENGQKTGFFLDQRESRAMVGRFSKGRDVLNMFSYSGGFSLYALKYGANFVDSVDISRKAVDLVDKNAGMMDKFLQERHRSYCEDVFAFLDRMPENRYNLVILDPPAFAKHHRVKEQGIKGYRNINRKTMEKIRPGGLLFTFSCSQAISRDDFQTLAFSAAALAGRNVRVIQHLQHAPDHPVSIFHPEGEYLKGLLLSVE